MSVFQSKLALDATELVEETIAVNRCALVVKGGRRFSFTAYVVVGNQNGILGLGHGKAKDVSSAIQKASKDARRNLFSIERDGTTVPHQMEGDFCSSTIRLMRANPGTGVIACTPVRAVMQMAGIHDVLTKSFGSNNPINLVKAAMDGLRRMRSKATVEALRGVSLS